MPVTQRSTNLALVRPLAVQPRDIDDPAERRAHERLTVSALTWLDQVRLKYGPVVSLIDLSVGGAQIEATGHRLRPGSTMVIKIAGRDGEVAIPSRVVRCDVAGISPHLVYRGALEFKRPFPLPQASEEVPPLTVDANPIHEHARLTVALKRVAESSGAAWSNDTLTGVGAASLSAALAMIESPSGRRAGTPFSSELSRLFRMISHSVEAGDALDQLLLEVGERLRRAVPARSVRLVDSVAPGAFQTLDAITFDVPSARGPGKKLLVEFPRTCRLEQWHLQLLKTAAHLVTLISELHDSRRAAEEPSRVEPIAPRDPAADKEGWHRLVLRYRDGRMLKGYGRDFLPAKGQVHLEAVPNGPPAARITVDLAHLKAVFFVHDFDGQPYHADPDAPKHAPGRKIAVTFFDGEVLTGTTLNYSIENGGFFVSPTETSTNNHRIFVVSRAVRNVVFP